MAVRSLAQQSLISPTSNNSMLVGYQTNMFHHLETVRLSSSASSVTFTNLGQYSDFQHLQLRLSARTNRSGADLDNVGIQLNLDSAGNYSWHQLYGDGNPPGSNAGTSTTFMLTGVVGGGSQASTIFGGEVTDLLDPFETTKYTTIRTFGGASTAGGKQVVLRSSLWRNTAAITQINIISITGSSFTAGSRFSLYGLKARA